MICNEGYAVSLPLPLRTPPYVALTLPVMGEGTSLREETKRGAGLGQNVRLLLTF